MPRLLPLAAACLLLAPGLATAQKGPIDVKVRTPTRLDWAFAVRGFGKDAAKLPPGYDSTKQRYQLYVPKGYTPKKAWPLVLFISAGNQPAGWGNWKKVCEKEGVLFCSPYGAGNSTPVGQRTRIIFDTLDDVRRAYRIDPEQTYLSGFSGGARMACALGFALPEYFGGLAPVCGTNPLTGLTYLRHRVTDRLSVALVTGETDFNRKENEQYMGPWLKDLGVRSRVWVVPKLAHAIPSGAVLAEVYAWLRDDLKRRRADAKAHPELAVAPNEAPASVEQAKRLLSAARAELKQPERVWRGVTLLQGITQRWGSTEAGQEARALLKQVGGDEKLLGLIAEQGAADEQKALSSQARALERFGDVARAIQTWQVLARNYQDTPVGRQAEENIRRLRKE